MTNGEVSNRLRGRTIVRVELRAFRDDRTPSEWTADPVLHLDDGSRLSFHVRETDSGTRYGIDMMLVG